MISKRNSGLNLNHGTNKLGLNTPSSSPPIQPSKCNNYDSFIRIADTLIGLACDSSDLTIHFTGAMEKFRANRGEPEIKIEVCWDELKEKPRGNEILNSNANWKLYSYDGSFLFRFTSPALGSIPYREALFNSDFSTGKIHLHRPVYPSGQPIDPLEYPLDELLVLNYLSRGRGVGIQACGVVNSQGHGYLILDLTGAGKSATARPWIGQPQQFKVLADDRIILRRQEGFLWMYSTPWQEDTRLALPARAPLKRVYFLRRGLKNELIPLSRADVVGRFLACSFPISYNQESVKFIVSFFEHLPVDILCFELRFLSDTEIVDSVLGGPKDLVKD